MAAPQLLISHVARRSVVCHTCKSARFSDYLDGRGYHVVRCLDCGLLYVNPQPREDELQDFYATFDTQSTWRGDGEERFDRKMRDIVLRFRPGGSILDVGSSRGNFLIAMRKAGFGVFGVEPSPGNSEYARTANGINTYTGTIESFLKEPSKPSFDVITILNVLEHVLDPRQVLSGLRKLLTENGILVVVVPDARLHALIGQSRQVLGFSDPFWMNTKRHPLVGFDPPAHLCSFEPRTISRLLEGCGFRVLARRNAPIILNQDAWKNVAKVGLHAAAEFLYFASFRQVVASHSTVVIASV